ncbi:MAG: CoA pyrophosphatase [Actinomycetia bacterium]|nr:CoA pyrophosphatase [Actinomycetes bacterium]
MMESMWDRLHYSSVDPNLPEGDVAAVLAPIFADEDGISRLVLTKRSRTLNSHAGQVAFPGGKSHPEDTGPVDTALRETYEEVGIHPSQVEVLGFLPVIRTVRFALPMLGVVARLDEEPEFIPSPDEVEKVLTPSLESLADPTNWLERNWASVPLWFMDVYGEWLWGATAHLVRVLLGLPVGQRPTDR